MSGPSGPGRSPTVRHRAVFVDRDGTLNPDLHYLADADRLEIFRGVVPGLRRLRAHGYLLVCVTNQSGVDRGFYRVEDVERIHRRLNDRLAAEGAGLDAFYYCPHAPERGCACRKPGTLLFETAAQELGISFSGSAIIGDRALDVEAGEKLGLETAIAVPPGHLASVEAELAATGATPDIVALSFEGAVHRLLGRG